MAGVKVKATHRGKVVFEGDVAPGERMPIPVGVTFDTVVTDGYLYLFTPQDFEPAPEPVRPTFKPYWS